MHNAYIWAQKPYAYQLDMHAYIYIHMHARTRSYNLSDCYASIPLLCLRHIWMWSVGINGSTNRLAGWVWAWGLVNVPLCTAFLGCHYKTGWPLSTQVLIISFQDGRRRKKRGEWETGDEMHLLNLANLVTLQVKIQSSFKKKDSHWIKAHFLIPFMVGILSAIVSRLAIIALYSSSRCRVHHSYAWFTSPSHTWGIHGRTIQHDLISLITALISARE